MKLCYRGAEYDYTPPVLEVTESEILGHYRGRPARMSYVRHIPFPQPVADLSYRGAAYHTNSHGQVEAAPASQSDAHATARSFPMFNSMAAARRQLLQEAARIHQDNIRRSLQHRIAVAQAQGNDALVRQLEEEMHQFA
ncbi:MAG: DUF4278 domain-containing protein [Leptolyngbyaceae cyanobacterium T60_A2020_046]|nr:DUF4278 domain-containing protein [Leptolyngbyaceae cyanobacterium T60_A2020_046]